MKPSSFQTTIENQFDYICKRAMEDERKNYMLYLSRIAKREVSFSDIVKLIFYCGLKRRWFHVSHPLSV